jgi:type VI protein secretion system component VasK
VAACLVILLLPTIPTSYNTNTEYTNNIKHNIYTYRDKKSIRVKQDRNSALPLAARRGNTLVSLGPMRERTVGGDRHAHELGVAVLPW